MRVGAGEPFPDGCTRLGEQIPKLTARQVSSQSDDLGETFVILRPAYQDVEASLRKLCTGVLGGRTRHPLVATLYQRVSQGVTELRTG